MTVAGTLDLSGVKDAAVKALGDAAEFLLAEANKTVPFDEGTLARSGQVTVDTSEGIAVVSYDTPYAVTQHEDTRLHHPNGRRAKWLQLALNENAGKIKQYLINETGLKSD